MAAVHSTNIGAQPPRYPTYVILGSGGHTAEMCKINLALLGETNATHRERYLPLRYLYAQSDKTSRNKLIHAMSEVSFVDDIENAFVEVPRSREVGQNWLTTIFTTFWALLWCCWLVWRDRPQLIICNGPGTCVPFCYAAYIWRLLGRLSAKTKIVYVESYCRVRSLSLSGKLLLPIADMFVVQWPALAERYKNKRTLRYFGHIM